MVRPALRPPHLANSRNIYSDIMDNKQNIEIGTDRTLIQNFYAGQSIFVTGSTGFLGKVLVEKLLRSCPDISAIYLLIRSRKDKSPENRLDEIFENLLYDQLKKEVPDFRKKVSLIVGDLEIEGLGLSENDKNTLIHKVSIIFHAAADINLQKSIKFHTQINVNATDTILSIAKLMPNLKSFIYVSTIYSNTYVKHIEERVYTYPINYKDLVTFTRTLPENVMEEKIARITSQWPNAYAFTKAITEALLRDEGGHLPIGIFRPAIITSTANEPLVGWNDNFSGPIRILVSIMMGFQRFMLLDPDISSNLSPVDLTANAIIASAWDVSNQCRKGKDMLIYNFLSPADAPTLGEYIYSSVEINETYPLSGAQWLPFIIFLQQKIPYKICIWFGHLLPALIVDAVRICMNYRPRMWRLYKKIHNYSKTMAPFITKQWSFSSDNVETMWDRLNKKDQQLFKFDMKKFDWNRYFIDHHKGIRFYLLNEDDSTLKISRIRRKRLYWIHQTFKTVFIFAVLWITWFIWSKED